MMVGTLIVMVWRTLFRKNHVGSGRARCGRARCQKAAKKEAAVAEEKAGLMEEQIAPPAYEDNTEGSNEESAEEETPKA